MLKITKKNEKRNYTVEFLVFFLSQMMLNYYRLNLLNNFYNIFLYLLIRLGLNSSIIEQHAKEILCYINRRVTEFSVGLGV